MAELGCECRDGVLLLRMSRGKANALNLSLVEELNGAVDSAAGDEDVRGVVVASACPGIFSAGFDVDEVFRYDRATMTLFFSRFIDLYESLSLLPKPVVAAVEGHAFAGGAILAMSCDFRVMEEGNFGFAINELDLGVVLPPGLILMLINSLGAGVTREILLTGERVGPGRARELGLVNQVRPRGDVLGYSMNRCAELAAKPRHAFAATKRSIRELCRGPYSRGDRNYLDEFIDHWFSEESTARREALAAGLARRRQDPPRPREGD
jgi:enoyl-CoA hydratase/carnithine racemase